MKMQVKFFVNKMQLWSCNNKKTNPKLFKFRIGFYHLRSSIQVTALDFCIYHFLDPIGLLLGMPWLHPFVG